MKLGEIVQIEIMTPDVTTAVAFYSQLGFQPLAQGDDPAAWQQMTDGHNVLLLTEGEGDRWRMRLRYATAVLAEQVAQLQQMGVDVEQQQNEEGELAVAVFTAADGLMVALINQDPTRPSRPAGESLSHCGKFGELTVCVGDFDRAAAFWTAVGYQQAHAEREPYPWGIFSDDLLTLGLHQMPEEDALSMTGPTMTYFAPDMAERIARIRAAGLSFAQEFPNEQSEVTGAVLEAPGGERLFLFEGDL